MTNRRNFIANSFLLSLGIATPILKTNASTFESFSQKKKKSTIKPIVASTWSFGMKANEKAWEILSANGYALDAVEKGVNVCENDPEVTSVGYGGLPDRDGNVTLDACIMDEKGNCGSVAFLENIKNPISVARVVMETTPYIMLAGQGALDFALTNGFKKENLLTYEAKLKWQEWMRSQNYHPEPDAPDKNNHDTIGMLAIDMKGQLCGACTTSGLAWKIHGRVGDSPIIGAGLFIDNEAGGAVATGKGESVIKIAGTHLIVEMMRLGKSPKEACKIAIERIINKQPDYESFQVGFIAMNKYGEVGTYALQSGFEYALHTSEGNKLIKSAYFNNEQVTN